MKLSLSLPLLAAAYFDVTNGNDLGDLEGLSAGNQLEGTWSSKSNAVFTGPVSDSTV